MNLSMKPRIRMAGSGESREKQVERLITSGYSVIELQHRRADTNNRRIFNFDDITISPYQPPNSPEIRYRSDFNRHAVLKFEPDENNILHAFAVDTPRNRRLIALMLDDNEFFVLRRHQLAGVDLTVVQQIRDLANQLKEEAKAKLVQKAKTSGAVIPAAIETGENTPKTYDDILASVYADNQSIVSFLSKRNPNWKESPEHNELLGPKINEMCALFGINAQQSEQSAEKSAPKAKAKKAAPEAVPDLASQV